MRHLLAILVSLFATSAATPARAAALIPAGSRLDVLLQAANAVEVNEDVDLDPDERFLAFFTKASFALGGGELRLSVEGDPDPSLDYRLEVGNLSSQSQFVSFLLFMPMMPIGPGSVVSASLDVSVTDADGSGGAFVAPLLPNIQVAIVSEDGMLGTSLGVDLGLGSFDPGASFSAGPIPGPAPNPAIGPTFNFLAINGGFSISAGDSAVLVGNVTIVPEPGLALVFAAGTLVLTVRRLA